MKGKPFFEGAGLAVLYVLPFADTFLTPSLGDAYHSVHPLATIYRAILMVLLLLWLLAALGFAVIDRLGERWRRAAWLLPFTLLPWLCCRALVGVDWAGVGAIALRSAQILLLVVALIGLVLFAFRPRVLDRCLAASHFIYTIAAFGLLVMLPRIALHAWHAEPQELTSFTRAHLTAASPSAPRIVWILMDELSYDQAFPSRQPDVALPNFDDFARSSVSFSNIQPVGDSTEYVLPALLLGKPVVALRTPYDELPIYRSSPQGPPQHFNQNDTIFAEARSLGWTTGVAGWYNPYCRLLPDVLDRCFWQFSEQSRNTLSRLLSSTNSISENMLAMLPARDRIEALLGHPSNLPPPHRRDYAGMMAQADDLVRDPRIRFVFLHLPIPHAPGIYDRTRHAMSEHGSYLDNLVLADQALGTLRHAIQSTPAAASTTVIVSSDHSWRTYMWRRGQDWSAEEERVSNGGKFDPRPVLMVHLADNDGARTMSQPVDAFLVHRILDGLLHDRIHTSGDISALAAGNQDQQARVQEGGPVHTKK